MIVLQTFVTLGAGFAAMAIVLALAAMIWRWRADPAQRMDGRSRGEMLWNLGTTLVAALLGGYVTAAAADRNPLIHALALGLIVLLLAALSAIQTRGTYPIWFALLMVALAPCAVVGGGLLRLNQMYP